MTILTLEQDKGRIVTGYRKERDMRVTTWVLWGILVWVCASSARAQTPPRASDDLNQQILNLQQRLEAAESRLHELEAEPVFAPAPVSEIFRPLALQQSREDQSEAEQQRSQDQKTGETPEDKKTEDENKDGEDGKDGEDKEDEERLKKLEEEWQTFQEEEAEKAADAAKEPTFSMGGRIHLDTWFFPQDTPGIGFFEHPGTGADPEDRIFFRRIRIEAGGKIFETMLYQFQLDFHSPSDGEYKDVYIGFTELPWNHTVLFGNQKRPLGLDHLNSSRFNVFIERPLVVEAFNEDARRIGAAAYMYTDDLLYNIRYGIYQLENTTFDGEYIGDSLQMSGNFRVASVPWYDEASGGRGYFHWAVAGMLARPDGDVSPLDSNPNEGRFRTRSELRSDERWLNTGRIRGAEWYEIAGLETIFNYGAFQFVAEQQFSWLQRDNTTPGTGPDLFFHGGYFYVAYFLTGEHVPIDRKRSTIERTKPFENFFLVERLRGGTESGWGAWQVALRLSYLDLTDRDIEGGVGRNVSLGLNWWWTSHSRLQLNIIRGDIADHRPQGGFTEGDFWAIGTRMAVDF